MIDKLTQNFSEDYKFILSESSLKSKKTNNLHHELNKLIHHEFQKDFIKKLYPDPKWTNRVYWNVIGRIQVEHEDLTLDNIIKGVDRYLEENNMCISQRDLLKFIRESIIMHNIEGKSKIEDVSTHATENGVTIDRFNEAITCMKADGSIFEPVEGFYKCI